MPDLELEAPLNTEASRDEFRTTNVSSKLTRSEVEQLDGLATERGLQRGELIRELVLRELKAPKFSPSASFELIEIVGLRMILTNLLRTVSQAKPITEERFEAIMAEVRRSKVQVATELVAKSKGGH